ncbi:MAG: extracellular solute-binding protein, partial [Clostridia bacterium]|nr:extracellular solute-binding protein [Clostridia bacterium]
MKKVLAIVLCLVLLTGAALAEIVYNAPGEYPIANEIVTIKILAPQDGEYSRAENLQTLELEEKLGIKIEWEIAPSGSMQDKLSTVFLRDPADQPDIVMTGVGAADRLSMIKEAELGAQGYILPLNEFLDTVSVGYAAAFENLPGL